MPIRDGNGSVVRLVNYEMVDESRLPVVQQLLVGPSLDASAQICTGRIPQEDAREEGGQDVGIRPVLRRVLDHLPEERRHVIEDVLVVERQLGRDLLALKVVG